MQAKNHCTIKLLMAVEIILERFFRLMNDFIDREMEMDLVHEFERTLEEEFFRDFYNTFRRTVELCHDLEREFESTAVPEELHWTLIHTIERTPQKQIFPQKRKKYKKR